MGKEQSCRFKRAHRVSTPSLYRRVFQSSQKRFQTSRFRLLCADNALDYPRLGIVVSKKSSPLATRRNWVKRVVRETFRQNASHLGGVDLVVIAREGCMKFTKQEFTKRKTEIKKQLRQEIELLWQKFVRS